MKPIEVTRNKDGYVLSVVFMFEDIKCIFNKFGSKLKCSKVSSANRYVSSSDLDIPYVHYCHMVKVAYAIFNKPVHKKVDDVRQLTLGL